MSGTAPTSDLLGSCAGATEQLYQPTTPSIHPPSSDHPLGKYLAGDSGHQGPSLPVSRHAENAVAVSQYPQGIRVDIAAMVHVTQRVYDTRFIRDSHLRNTSHLRRRNCGQLARCYDHHGRHRSRRDRCHLLCRYCMETSRDYRQQSYHHHHHPPRQQSVRKDTHFASLIPDHAQRDRSVRRWYPGTRLHIQGVIHIETSHLFSLTHSKLFVGCGYRWSICMSVFGSSPCINEQCFAFSMERVMIFSTFAVR